MKGMILVLMLVIGFASTPVQAGCIFTKLILEHTEDDCEKAKAEGASRKEIKACKKELKKYKKKYKKECVTKTDKKNDKKAKKQAKKYCKKLGAEFDKKTNDCKKEKDCEEVITSFAPVDDVTKKCYVKNKKRLKCEKKKRTWDEEKGKCIK
jgi:GTPase involved in cell partitioning and DNA repair